MAALAQVDFMKLVHRLHVGFGQVSHHRTRLRGAQSLDR
jgi:hypothetical protein